jgi:hypothetical protein
MQRHLELGTLDGTTSRSAQLSKWRQGLSSPFARSVSLWENLRSNMFQTRSADLLNRKQRISDEIDAIPQAVLRGVVETVLIAVHQCINLDGHVRMLL